MMKGLISLLICLMLAGCGLKGELYLPEDEPKEKTEESKGTA